MTISTVLPIWNAVRDRFQKTVSTLPQKDLHLQLGTSSIGNLVYHTAEVEYMFAEWFFGKKMPEKIEKPSFENIEELVTLLKESNAFLIEAMSDLDENNWQRSVSSPIGESTPLEAVGRLMYHTGIHSGQISMIQKNGHSTQE